MWHIFIFLIISVSAFPKSDEEYKKAMVKYVLKCQKEHPVEMAELFNLEKLIVPTNKETKCLLACAYKLEGSMTKEGMYNEEHGRKWSEDPTAGDEKRRNNIKKLSEICSKVNKKAVSDTKGCERAGLIFKCVVENAPKLGFKV